MIGVLFRLSCAIQWLLRSSFALCKSPIKEQTRIKHPKLRLMFYVIHLKVLHRSYSTNFYQCQSWIVTWISHAILDCHMDFTRLQTWYFFRQHRLASGQPGRVVLELMLSVPRRLMRRGSELLTSFFGMTAEKNPRKSFLINCLQVDAISHRCARREHHRQHTFKMIYTHLQSPFKIFSAA